MSPIDILAVLPCVLLAIAAATCLRVPGLGHHCHFGLRRMPYSQLFAVMTGLCIASALLIGAPYREELLPYRVFAADSVWTMLPLEFLLSHAIPDARLVAVFSAVLDGHGEPWSASLLRVAAAGWLGGFLVNLLARPGPAGVRAAFAFLGLIALSALAAIYLAHALAWVSHHLNFWSFLLGCVLFQKWRYRAERTDDVYD